MFHTLVRGHRFPARHHAQKGQHMRVGTVLDFGRPMSVVGDEIAAWEAAGLASATLGEAYSFDAATQLAYLAARTTSIELATGVLPLDTRTPTLIATTAAG